MSPNLDWERMKSSRLLNGAYTSSVLGFILDFMQIYLNLKELNVRTQLKCKMINDATSS